MQLGTDLSTSQVEYNFIGTGFVFAEQKPPPPSADIFTIKNHSHTIDQKSKDYIITNYINACVSASRRQKPDTEFD